MVMNMQPQQMTITSFSLQRIEMMDYVRGVNQTLKSLILVDLPKVHEKRKKGNLEKERLIIQNPLLTICKSVSLTKTMLPKKCTTVRPI